MMRGSARFRRAGAGLVAAACAAAGGAFAQQGITQSLPASAVMAAGGQDWYHEQGGVVGPWWSGSSTSAMPPAANGGFWFGFPGLGFGGSQGSTRGANMFGSSVTTMQGGTGMTSSSRLVPFVTGVVPVVGSGSPFSPVTTGLSLDPAAMPPVITLPTSSSAPVSSMKAVAPGGPLRPSTPEARHRASELVAAADLILLGGADARGSAKAAMRDYRSASRFAPDEADIEIRLAILHEGLGERRDANRAIARAEKIDGRLTRPLNPVPAAAGGFLASPPPGIPVIAARGFVILDEMARGDAPDGASQAPAAVVWLSEAWARRWGTTPAAAMLVEP